MIRSLFAILALATAAISAPLPKEKEAELYYPVQVGAKRVMEVRGNEAIETVEKVETKEGKYLVTLSLEAPASKARKGATSVLEVSAKGVARIRMRTKDLEEPFIMLKLPAKVGDSWKYHDATYKVGEEQQIEVPAGKSKAIPVSTESDRGGVKLTSTSWYAPKVGLIKTVTSVGNGASDRISVLKSFTPGK